MDVSVGADPELFLINDKGVPVSAYGVIPGSKHAPFAVDNGAIQVDGMALEFNINPATDEERFVQNLNSVMATMSSMLPYNNSISMVPVAEFGSEYIQSQPDDAKRLGCEPDFDAWRGGMMNRPPNGELPFRTAAGHVHIGWTKVDDALDYNHIQDCCGVIKQMDFFLGMPSLLFDKDTKRRMMYGKPGCFRPKEYGVEYRVMSNQWLLSDDLKRWVFRNVKAGMERWNKGDFVFYKVNKNLLKMLTAADPDLQRVRVLLEHLNIELPPVESLKRAA